MRRPNHLKTVLLGAVAVASLIAAPAHASDEPGALTPAPAAIVESAAAPQEARAAQEAGAGDAAAFWRQPWSALSVAAAGVLAAMLAGAGALLARLTGRRPAARGAREKTHRRNSSAAISNTATPTRGFRAAFSRVAGGSARAIAPLAAFAVAAAVIGGGFAALFDDPVGRQWLAGFVIGSAGLLS
ncbi:MAG: hypothetical protein AAFQ96_04235, partial [Pseudomonadota bacterium]